MTVVCVLFFPISTPKDFKKASNVLIPISRLPFPRSVENQRLVKYDSDNRYLHVPQSISVGHYLFCSYSHAFSDDDEVATFFPVPKRKMRRKHRETQPPREDLDTFSIQEMTIVESDSNDGDKSSEDDDCDSQLNLELPQRSSESLLAKIRSALCCYNSPNGVF